MTPEQLAKSGTEHAIQRAVFARVNAYIREHVEPTDPRSRVAEQLKWLHAIPNGGDRHGATAGKMKAEGAKAGVWDMFLPVPIASCVQPGYCEQTSPEDVANKWRCKDCDKQHGLYIEIKVPERRNHENGGLTDEQVKFGNAMNAAGYALAVCYSWEEVFDAIMKYLRGEHA